VRRWLTPGIFLAIALVTGAHAVEVCSTFASAPSWRHALLAVYAVLRALVAAAFTVFTLDRAEPHRRARAPIAFAACGFAMVAVALVSGPSRETPAGLLLAGDAVAVGGCVWLLASALVLGRCFGVLPEARGLVRSGPYRLVRHPVYLGEIAAIGGLTLAAPAVWNALVWALFVVAQMIRIGLEERALTDAFPEYSIYAAATSRLLPSRLWAAVGAAAGRGPSSAPIAARKGNL
jgi:protein-S-isoprenylcysteine O-methyltransferase Ste14